MDDEHPGIRQAAWMAQEGHGLLIALEARFDRLPYPLDRAQLLRWHHLWGGGGRRSEHLHADAERHHVRKGGKEPNEERNQRPSEPLNLGMIGGHALNGHQCTQRPSVH